MFAPPPTTIKTIKKKSNTASFLLKGSGIWDSNHFRIFTVQPLITEDKFDLGVVGMTT